MTIFQTLSLVLLIGFVSSENHVWKREIKPNLQEELQKLKDDKISFTESNRVSLEESWKKLSVTLTLIREKMREIKENIPFEIVDSELVFNEKETEFQEIASECYYRLSCTQEWIQDRMELLQQKNAGVVESLRVQKQQISTVMRKLTSFMDGIYQKLNWFKDPVFDEQEYKELKPLMVEALEEDIENVKGEKLLSELKSAIRVSRLWFYEKQAQRPQQSVETHRPQQSVSAYKNEYTLFALVDSETPIINGDMLIKIETSSGNTKVHTVGLMMMAFGYEPEPGKIIRGKPYGADFELDVPFRDIEKLSFGWKSKNPREVAKLKVKYVTLIQSSEKQKKYVSDDEISSSYWYPLQLCKKLKSCIFDCDSK